MSITLPGHNFPYWSDPAADGKPPVLIIGAGLSADLAPLPFQLVREIAKRQDQIEAALQIQTGFVFTRKKPADPLGLPDELYRWAGCCMEQLMLVSASELDAKQSFVAAMGLLEDERFAANANVPLRGTTPRHRVLARLAREACVHSFWSLNWDLWLEAAFEAVGLIRLPLNSNQHATDLPSSWKKVYEVWLPPNLPGTIQNVVTLYKPHGCVRALYEGENSTFRITEAELTAPTPADVKLRLQSELYGRPVCSIGWGATEGNIQSVFAECATASILSGGLTVVGLDWNDREITTDSRHSKLAGNFGQNEGNTLCQVKATGPGTTDELMQWIQALRSLRRFHSVVESIAPTETSSLGQLSAQIQLFSEPVSNDGNFGWALPWFDTFFPVWSRLCFISKALVFQNDGDVPTDALSLLPRDVHIPLNDTATKRWDILSGAYLYCGCLNSGALVPNELDFESYPGAFWHQNTRTLLIPIPTWADAANISLAALKPLVESRHWAGMGRVERVCMLRARVGPPNQDDAITNSRICIWKQQFCALMRLGAFVDVNKIDDEEMFNLLAYLQSRKDAK